MSDYKRPMTLRECADAEEAQPSRQVNEKVSNFSCYDSNKEVYTQIYDPNGNALQMSEIVELLNDLLKKRNILEAVKEASKMCEQSRAKYIYEIVKDC